MLDASGLLPPGRHVVTPEQIEQVFVDQFPASNTRARLFARWTRHWAALNSVLPILGQWIDGSFVTDKMDPADIDLVVFLDGPEFMSLAGPAQDMAAAMINGKGTKAVWGMDSYPIFVFPAGDPMKSHEETARTEWDALWSQVREQDGVTKGYLEVRP